MNRAALFVCLLACGSNASEQQVEAEPEPAEAEPAEAEAEPTEAEPEPAPTPPVDPSPATSDGTPDLNWLRRGCWTGEAIPFADAPANHAAIAANEDGGLVLAIADNKLRAYPIHSNGDRRGEPTELPIRAPDDGVAVQRVEQGFLAISAGRCGRERCYVGWLLDDEGRPTRETQAPRENIDGSFHALDLADRASDRLWIVGEAGTGRDTRYIALSVSVEGEAVAFTPRQIFGLSPDVPIAEASYVNVLRASPRGETFHALVDWEAETPEGPQRGRVLVQGSERVDVSSLEGAIQDFIATDGDARALVKASDGALTVSAFDEEAAAVATQGALPPGFEGRVVVRMEDGAVTLRDSRGTALTEPIPEVNGKDLTFTGNRFLVVRERDILPIDCGGGR